MEAVTTSLLALAISLGALQFEVFYYFFFFPLSLIISVPPVASFTLGGCVVPQL